MRRGPPLIAVVTLLALLTLTGCSLSPPVSPSPPLAAAASEQTLASRLTLTPNASTRDETPTPSSAKTRAERTLMAFIRITPTALRAALVTPYGQRLTTLVRDADGARFEAGDAPGEPPLPIPPDWLASRLEWSLWPRESLERAFAGSEWSIDEDATRREIRRRGTLVARITPAPRPGSPRPLTLDDREGGYRLTITPREADTP
ncbi:DUF3261 domain-containing protein [Salinicola aestuarinus]|uniref:DUF3261 domain-containing protein n=1 Tax=Salinicola aestuarinus TaxID=1949082 RepID=UPI000DA229A7|nr:DUF3261 domain-containing protein [Salinicola aestuarinus]